jgi:hypothetical protein
MKKFGGQIAEVETPAASRLKNRETRALGYFALCSLGGVCHTLNLSIRKSTVGTCFASDSQLPL